MFITVIQTPLKYKNIRHNHQLKYLSNSKSTSNSCCINLGHPGPDGVQVTIISYNIYQTLKLLVIHVVLTLATPDQMSILQSRNVQLIKTVANLHVL